MKQTIEFYEKNGQIKFEISFFFYFELFEKELFKKFCCFSFLF